MQKNEYSLEEIVKSVAAGEITLPTVQRGFVWKPHQIENLWDSLLRGYPTGSFVVSQNTDSEEKLELLDGQQRATAICLGFYNPIGLKSSSEVFKTSFENFVIFIDLAKPNNGEDRKYYVRVITKSQPWGYRKKENQKTLESAAISRAMGAYGIEGFDYLKKPLEEFWPYDAIDPIPLGLFIDAAVNNKGIVDLKKNIEAWKNKRKITTIGDEDVPNASLYKIENIFDAVIKMLKTQKIPWQYLDLDHFSSVDDEASAVNQSEKSKAHHAPDVENEDTDEIENLFIRLNSGGTPLRGEELNYSVLKAHITRELQIKLEARCEGIFQPARFVTIAYRLFGSYVEDDDEKDSTSMKIKPKQFQRNMRKRKGAFRDFLVKEFVNSDIIARVKEILTYNKESNRSGLPIFIVGTLAERAPEIMFLLLYRLLIKKDKIDFGLRSRVLGIITLFVWLGKGERQKDHKKLLDNVWPCVKNFETNKFWSKETVERAMLPDANGYRTLVDFPGLRKLDRIIPKKSMITNLTWEKICDPDSNYGNFIDKIFFNKDLVLYAQRHSLHAWFHETENIDLDDTNRVFDWDHIFPNSAIQNKKNINRALKDWYLSNGNYRAWPYSLNRKDQADSPADKLNPKSEEYASHLQKFLKCESQTQLSQCLLDSSFCDHAWLGLTAEDKEEIKYLNTAKRVLYLILERNIDLCKEWYTNLLIDDLVFDSPSAGDVNDSFDAVIDKRKWLIEKKAGRTEYTLSFDEDDKCVYFSFDNETRTLSEDETYFGIYSEAAMKVKVTKKLQEKYIKSPDDKDVYNYFTLVSHSSDSITELFRNFYKWLNEFPETKIREKAIKKFRKSLAGNYANKVTNT